MRVIHHIVLIANVLLFSAAVLAAPSGERAKAMEQIRQNRPAADGGNRASLYGHPAPAAHADRVIEIRPGRKFVNVTTGETVLFKVGEKSFAWKFSPALPNRHFALDRITPGDIDVRGVTVYCVPDLHGQAGRGG